MGKRVFVTVGTTEFNELVKQVDSAKFLGALKERGFDEVEIQIGRGSYEPACRSETDMTCTFFRFKPTLDDSLEKADLVISHAGAGSIMESLRRNKPLVVVINQALMDNHQEELADALERRGFLKAVVCDTLVETIRNHSLKFEVYPEANHDRFPSLVNQEMFVNNSKDKQI